MKYIFIFTSIVFFLLYACEKDKPSIDEPDQNMDTISADTTRYLDSTLFKVTITRMNDTIISSVETHSDEELIESIHYTYSDSVAFKTYVKGDLLIKSTYYLNERKLAYVSVDSIFADVELIHVIQNYWTYDNDGYLIEKISYPESIYFSGEDSSIITYYYIDGNQHVKDMDWSNGSGNTWMPYYNYSENSPILKHDIIEFNSGIIGRLNRTLPFYYEISAGKGGTWDRRSFNYVIDLEGNVTKRIDTLYNEIVHYESRPNEALSREIFIYTYR
jgi:hypothetical protein